jgi:hypothetical protein
MNVVFLWNYPQTNVAVTFVCVTIKIITKTYVTVT